MKLLLAGPGTGKTTRVKRIVASDYADAARILVLSFTNATVRDLTADFAECDNVDCYTLHKYALRINHLKDRYILDRSEEETLRGLADSLGVASSFFCEQLRCITFDAMVEGCLSFLKANPIYGAEQIGPLDLLIVDEYQDFNGVERALVGVIAQHATEAIILGDDDQSIYGFKDADPEGIIQLYHDGAVTKVDQGGLCYRCPAVVVDHAGKLIQHNVRRVDKPWKSTGKDGDYRAVQMRSQADAVNYVAAEITRHRTASSAESFLVLSPMEFCVDGLREALDASHIPYVDFWRSRLSDEAYRRVWWLRAIFTDRGLLNLLLLWKSLTPYYRRKLKDVLGVALKEGFDDHVLIESIRDMYDSSLSRHIGASPELADFAHTHPEFGDVLARLDGTDVVASAESLLSAINPAIEFDRTSVNVMSIHKSKGLQAEVVFVLGLVDGVLPDDSRGTDTIEAQRRLLFVGMTRAQKALHLVSWVEWGSSVHKCDKFIYKYQKKCYYGRTSRFIEEMEAPTC